MRCQFEPRPGDSYECHLTGGGLLTTVILTSGKNPSSCVERFAHDGGAGAPRPYETNDALCATLVHSWYECVADACAFTLPRPGFEEIG